MFEKLRVVFTIPELRQKIFLTLMFLGIYRVGFWITLPMVDQSAVAGLRAKPKWNLADILNAGRRCSVPATLTQRDHLRLGHHALYLRLDYLPVARERLEADRGTEERG
jgi:hypothetical protein